MSDFSSPSQGSLAHHGILSALSTERHSWLLAQASTLASMWSPELSATPTAHLGQQQHLLVGCAPQSVGDVSTMLLTKGP